MQIRVEKIVSLQFRHDYFSNELLDWELEWPETYNREFIPTITIPRSTQKKLENWGLFFRASGKGFDLYASVKEDSGKLYLERSIEENSEFYFFIQPPQNNWSQFTRKIGSEKGLIFYSNQNGFKAPGSNSITYLHNEIQDSYDGVKVAGQLIRKGNKVYEALERTSTKPPGSTWSELGNKVDFTTLSSTIDYLDRFLRISETSLANKNLEIKDNYGNVVFSKTFEASSEEKETSIDLTELNEGVYSYEIDAVLKGTFFKTENFPKGTIGVIQIVLQNNTAIIPGPQKLDEGWLPVANGTGSLNNLEINPRQFIIHFLPNRANWKYILTKDIGVEAADVTAAGYQKLSNTEFISNESITISKDALGADFGLDQRLPAASASLLIPQLNAIDEIKSYVSEIYVNV